MLVKYQFRDEREARVSRFTVERPVKTADELLYLAIKRDHPRLTQTIEALLPKCTSMLQRWAYVREAAGVSFRSVAYPENGRIGGFALSVARPMNSAAPCLLVDEYKHLRDQPIEPLVSAESDAMP